jgi:leucyl aminopeptidase (aminopeptidase T)
MSVEELMVGARIAVNQCMKIQPDERVIIITDEKMPRELSEALARAVKEVGAGCIVQFMKPLKVNGQEPTEDIAELMKTPDALFLVTSRSLSHTKARREASKVGVRIASMPKVTEFSFTKGGLTADYRKVKELTEMMAEKLKGAKTIRITSDNGTDFIACVEGREWKNDDGMIHEKGNFCNLPAGEVAIAPIEGTAQGVVVVDKMAYYGDGIRWFVKDGFVEKIEGSELLERVVNEISRNSRNIAEIGIGTNYKARIIGNILEDEKVFGTVHIALGNNLSLGGKVDVPLHVDGIIIKPNLEADGKLLIKDGRWTFLESLEEIPRSVSEEAKTNEEQRRIVGKQSSTQSSEKKIHESVSFHYNFIEDRRRPYEPYIIREPLESHYFDPWVGGWTRLNGGFVVNPQLYGYWIKVVEIHEKIHNLYKTGDETFVEKMTWHVFRNCYSIS